MTDLHSILAETVFNSANIGFKALYEQGVLANYGDIAYHYTSEVGLEPILHSKKIWAGRLDQMNDDTEVLYSLERTRDILRYYYAQAEHISRPDVEKELLRALWEKAATIVQQDIFAASLTFQPDLPVHWERYGGKGNGYAIGFKLQKPSADSPSKVLYTQVLYEEEHQKTLVGRAIHHFVTEIGRLEAEHSVSRQMDQVKGFADQLVRLLTPAMKAPEWSAEKEVRLVVTGNDTEDLHQQQIEVHPDKTVIPLSQPDGIQDFLVENILIGPCVTRPDAINYVRQLCDSTGFPNVQIISSTCSCTLLGYLFSPFFGHQSQHH